MIWNSCFKIYENVFQSSFVTIEAFTTSYIVLTIAGNIDTDFLPHALLSNLEGVSKPA